MTKKIIKIAFVLSDQMLATSTMWPADILSAANQVAKKLCPDAPRFEWFTIAAEDRPIKCQSGFNLTPDITINEEPECDIIFLPALWRNPKRIVTQSYILLEWLKHQHELGTIINGVGTGCCFMAEAGLLDHKPATTHWYYFDIFQKNYPLVQLKRQHFITQANSLYCTASINSLADLTIYFTQRFMNQNVAQHLQRHFSHEVRSDFEKVSYFEDDNTNHTDESILQAQLWIQSNVNKTITLTELSKQFDMSTRHFSRRFKIAMGKTPIQYLHECRLKISQDLLQSSNLSVSEIADRVGFNETSHFNKLFKREFSLTPKEYRTTVRAKLFNSNF